MTVADVPEPPCRDGWVRVNVRAGSINQHDVWILKGTVPLTVGLPAVIGMDAAGTTDDGQDVIVHAVLADPAFRGSDETLDPRRTFLPEAGHGTLAEVIVVPRRNLVAKPKELSWAEAACLPTAWLTAYRMLFTKAGARAGDRVLIQGAGGAVSTAAIVLARAAGLQVHVTARDPVRGERARRIGAHEIHQPDDRLPDQMDIVIESVGAATWKASLAAARPGGCVVVCGASTGFTVPTNLARIFSKQLRIAGSTMGTRAELESLAGFLVAHGVRPVVDSVKPLAQVAHQFDRLLAGAAFGKLAVSM
ncbi:zinc-binding dehydrogenase [Arthrobacter sp. I2-34]|uniref:Zinc-binding dehydrogenase n=1 Tax=Arthrobacter hankyongi TaxID=2904801 RepID=A0ABS9L9N1_9MICC|nr:zinc-binding dehydrogenase [Arthrobacter hankyongi]MCG2623380.1 zinc-binding dehydrogenase [Arthrobacter hankyongi]